MKSLWTQFKGGREASSRAFTSLLSLQPEHSCLAVGDLHGSYKLLFDLNRLIDEPYLDWPIVFLGDYVDRGEQSREVLQVLMKASCDSPSSIICLMGNHEQMLLDFLDKPEACARRWLRNGGLQTLASFGVSMPRGNANDARAYEELRDQLAEAMGVDMITWLRRRPLWWRSGNVWFVHAGADHGLSMDEQNPDVLLWGHREFAKKPREDGQWIVHGHTVVDAPKVQDGRIALDTGAYATGRLSAAGISKNDLVFFRTGSDR